MPFTSRYAPASNSDAAMGFPPYCVVYALSSDVPVLRRACAVRGLFSLRQFHRDIKNHILLATHHAAASQLFEQCPRVNAKLFGGAFSVQEEGRIDAGI